MRLGAEVDGCVLLEALVLVLELEPFFPLAPCRLTCVAHSPTEEKAKRLALVRVPVSALSEPSKSEVVLGSRVVLISGLFGHSPFRECLGF